MGYNKNITPANTLGIKPDARNVENIITIMAMFLALERRETENKENFSIKKFKDLNFGERFISTKAQDLGECVKIPRITTENGMTYNAVIIDLRKGYKEHAGDLVFCPETATVIKI